MNRSRIQRPLLKTVLALTASAMSLSACERPAAQSAESASQQATQLDTAIADSLFAAQPTREDLPTARIYYTLTDHEWYARGEPLLHDGTPYVANSRIVTAAAPDMEHVGAYQGVDYYSRRDDGESVFYVPVFQGYWQPFRATDPPPRGP